MDPLSAAASVAGLITLAGQLGKMFADFRDRCANIPARLHALNNEVTDLALVLQDVAVLLNSTSGGSSSTNCSSSIQRILAHLELKLQELKLMVEGPLASKSARHKFPPLQVHAWSKVNPRLEIIGQEIRTHKLQLCIALEASNSRDLARIRLDVESISTSAAMNSELLKLLREEFLGGTLRLHDRITGSIDSLDQRIDERLARVEELVIHHVPSRIAASSQDLDPTSTSRELTSFRPRADAVGFRLRSSQDICCRPGCRCACHRPASSASPAMLDRVVGQLFVGYSGIPFLRSSCDNPLCERPLNAKISFEYWFPLGLFWSLIIQVLCTYTSHMGPSLQVRTIRRVPDNATCVEFAISGNTEGLKYLFRHGMASPRDVSSTRGYSLLRWALYTKKFDTCIFLLNEGADPNYGTYGSGAASLGTYKVTSKDRARSMLLEPNLTPIGEKALRLVLEDDDWIDDCCFTAIHRAVVGLSKLTIQEAIKSNPTDINAPDSGGRSPVAWAALRRDSYAVGILLSHGANPNVAENHGSTPLYNAAENGSAECCKLLLEAGALPDPPKPKGARLSSALVAATIDGKEPLTAEVLIKFGANIEACGPDGKTALIHASRMNNARFAALLLDKGAKINSSTAAGETPLTTAITYNSHEVLVLLLERWKMYEICPRSRGRHLLPIIARYADCESMELIKGCEHIRRATDKVYARGSFAKQLRERFDSCEKLSLTFRDLVLTIGTEAGVAGQKKCEVYQDVVPKMEVQVVEEMSKEAEEEAKKDSGVVEEAAAGEPVDLMAEISVGDEKASLDSKQKQTQPPPRGTGQKSFVNIEQISLPINTSASEDLVG